MRPITSIMSDLQGLLHKLGAQTQRDFREMMRLRKTHGRPRSYGQNTLPILYKVIERYEKDNILPFTFMSQEDWDNLEGNRPLYTCVIDLCGFENILRGLPLYCISCDIYYKGTLTYTILYEPACEVILGAETKEGCYVLGGAKIRSVCVPKEEPEAYVWCVPNMPPPAVTDAPDIYIIREKHIAALWVIMSRVGAAVMTKDAFTPALRLLINSGECFTKVFENLSIFGAKDVVIRIYDSLQKQHSPH